MSSGLPLLAALIEFGVIVWLLLVLRDLNREANELNDQANRLTKLVYDQREQLRVMRRIYQNRPHSKEGRPK